VELEDLSVEPLADRIVASWEDGFDEGAPSRVIAPKTKPRPKREADLRAIIRQWNGSDVAFLGYGAKPEPLDGAPVWNQGVRALRAGLPGLALERLQAATADDPVDPGKAYWLARLHLYLDGPHHQARAAALAQRAARLALGEADADALTDAERHRAAAAWLLGARAADLLGQGDRARRYGARAAELVPDRAEPLVQEARRALDARAWGEARQAAIRAFWLHPPSLYTVLASPVLQADEDQRERLLAVLRKHVALEVARKHEIAAALGMRRDPPSSGGLRKQLPAASRIIQSTLERLQRRPRDLDQLADAIVEAARLRDEREAHAAELVATTVADRRGEVAAEGYTTQRQLEHLRFAGPVAAGAALALLMVLRFGGWMDVGVVATLAGAVVGFLWLQHNRRLTEHRAAVAAAEHAYAEALRAHAVKRESASLAVVSADAAVKDARDTLAAEMRDFQSAVERFETELLAQPLLRPSVPLPVAKPGDLVTLAATDAQDRDDALLPERLVAAARYHAAQPTSPYRLVRLREDGRLSRRGVWFDEPVAPPVRVPKPVPEATPIPRAPVPLLHPPGAPAPETDAFDAFASITGDVKRDKHVYEA
jgi:Tfp pilus assembly protein PilF